MHHPTFSISSFCNLGCLGFLREGRRYEGISCLLPWRQHCLFLVIYTQAMEDQLSVVREDLDVWPMMMTEAGRTALVTGRKLIISSAAMCWSESPRSLMCVYSKITWEPHHRPVNSIRISRLVSILLRNGCTMQPKLQNTKSIAPLILETWTQNIQLGP